MTHIEVYTDGSATTKNNSGGWAYVLVIDGKKYAECGGHMEKASNNDAETAAAIHGLAAALVYINETVVRTNTPLVHEVTLCSDSQLVLGWITGRYRFKQLDKLDKYEQLKFLANRLNIKTQWIKGHSGNEFNDRCDKLANEARLGVSRKKDREQAITEGKTLIGTKKSGTICLFYKGKLKVVDLETDIVEEYNRDIHGPRGGVLEVREEKSR